VASKNGNSKTIFKILYSGSMGNRALTEETKADLANNNDPNNNAEEFSDVANWEQDMVSVLQYFFCH
jgi:hypothetical protein